MVQKQRETEFFGGRLLKLSPIPASVPLSSPPATPPPNTHCLHLSISALLLLPPLRHPGLRH